MAVGGYHQVTRVIGIAIQNDEVVFTPEQYVVLSIVSLLGLFTEKAPLHLSHLDILYTPRCPNVLHFSLLMAD
jgi:hypothetical protein